MRSTLGSLSGRCASAASFLLDRHQYVKPPTIAKARNAERHLDPRWRTTRCLESSVARRFIDKAGNTGRVRDLRHLEPNAAPTSPCPSTSATYSTSTLMYHLSKATHYHRILPASTDRLCICLRTVNIIVLASNSRPGLAKRRLRNRAASKTSNPDSMRAMRGTSNERDKHHRRAARLQAQ
jgi:hypothetical protein